MHALLFTDVVDSTQISGRIGDPEAARLWTEHDRRARDLLRLHGGREIDRTDGFFLLFERPAAALRYALAYHEILIGLGLQARAGLHVGAVSLRANPADDVARGAKPIEVEGLAKSLAARVMALARGRQTLLSAAARDALDADDIENCEIERHGFYRLKGIEAPVEIFEVGRRGACDFRPPPDGDKAYQVVRVGGRWQPVREVPHNLPAERDSFVGRHQELRELAGRLDAGRRLVMVLGPGGAGKTRFVREYARAWMGDWPGGAYFCDLSESRDIEGICYSVASALGLELGPLGAPAQIGHAIAGRGRCLVILDNFEQVVGLAAESVGAWMDAAAEASFLVTSRERMQLPGETLFPLGPLPVAAEGVQLFCERAEAQRPEFRLDDRNRDVVTDIVRHLDGLPLAIELAAARIAVFTPAQLLGRLQDRFRVLVAARGHSARQATLRHAIDWSWTLLTPPEQAALAQLSVFEGGFTLESAEAVLDLDGSGPAVEAVDVVQALVDKSLLRNLGTPDQNDEGAGHYFGMLASIREYACDKLRGAGPDELTAAERRHAEHFATLGSDDQVEALSGPHGVALHRRLALSFDNLLASCRRAASHGWASEAIATLRATWEVLELHGPVELATTLGSQVLGLPSLTGHDRLLALMVVAMPLHHAGRIEEARDLLDQALASARELCSLRLEGRVLAQRGALLLDLGSIDAARADLEMALANHRSSNDRRAEGTTLGSLGNLHFDQGSFAEARRHYEAALLICRETGNRRVEGNLLGNLGLLHFEQGHLSQALECYEAALAVHREIGSRRLEGIVLGNLGLLHAEQGDWGNAEQRYEEALTIHREVGNRLDEGIVLGNLGELRLKRGALSDAQACLVRALAVARETGYRRAEGGVLGAIAELRATQGQYSDAVDALQSGESILRELGDRVGLGKLLCIRARVELERGDVAGARRTLEDAEALAQAAGAGPASELGGRLARLRTALQPG